MANAFGPPRPLDVIDEYTRPTVGMRGYLLKINGLEVIIPITLNTRPAMITEVELDESSAPTGRYKISDYYYGYEREPVATNLIAYPLDPSSSFKDNQRVLVISSGDRIYIVGFVSATSITAKITGTYNSGAGGYPFTEWDPIANAAVSGGETGYAQEYNGTAIPITDLIVELKKHGNYWRFFYPVIIGCDE